MPGTTVNRFCASSLQTLRMAFHAIRAGEGDTYVASGVEAVSRLGGGAPLPFHPQLDGSEGSLVNVYIPMGLTAENVAEREGISREAQDRWAAISQQRAVEAQASGHFDREIVPVVVPEHTAHDENGDEVTSRRRPSRRTTVRAPARPRRSSRSSSRPSSPTAPSRPATPARSTTAPPPCS